MSAQGAPPVPGEAPGGQESPQSIGGLIRRWRRQRSLSQHALALRAGVSTRYLSFIETGRAQPSRTMVSRLAEALSVPLGERNSLLVAAGYAPMFASRELSDPKLAPVRYALGRLLAGHEPYPALLVDRSWDIRAANRGARLLTRSVPSEVLEPVPNLVRVLLHPAGLGARIQNLEHWSPGLVRRVHGRLSLTCDPGLEALYEEIVAYPGVAREQACGGGTEPEALLLKGVQTARGERDVALLPMVTTFAAAADVTVSELSIEAFFPADDASRLVLADDAAGRQPDQGAREGA